MTDKGERHFQGNLESDGLEARREIEAVFTWLRFFWCEFDDWQVCQPVIQRANTLLV